MLIRLYDNRMKFCPFRCRFPSVPISTPIPIKPNKLNIIPFCEYNNNTFRILCSIQCPAFASSHPDRARFGDRQREKSRRIYVCVRCTWGAKQIIRERVHGVRNSEQTVTIGCIYNPHEYSSAAIVFRLRSRTENAKTKPIDYSGKLLGPFFAAYTPALFATRLILLLALGAGRAKMMMRMAWEMALALPNGKHVEFFYCIFAAVIYTFC